MGDIESMPFVEAFRQFQFRVGDGPGNPSFLSVHVSLVPETTDHEQKTKPTQHSIRELRGLGISPDIVICRSKNELGEKVKSKLAMFCHVTPSRVVSVHDCSSIYRVPLLLESQVNVLNEVGDANAQTPLMPTCDTSEFAPHSQRAPAVGQVSFAR